MKRIFAAAVLTTLVFFTGCFALPVEEAFLPPPIVEVPESRPLRTVTAERGDVLRFSNPPTNYLPLRQEAMHFNVGGQRIRGVFVEVGDEVYEGEVLAELERPYIWTQLEEARWEEEWLLLNISQLNQRHEFALEQAAVTSIPVDDLHYIEERERLNGQLGIVRMRVDYLYSEAERMLIRAPFDGVVVFALEFHGVMWSSVGQTVVTVADQGEYIFRMLGADAEHIVIGQIYEKSINGEPFLSEAIDPDAEGIERPAQMGAPQPEAFFRIIGEDMPVITTVAVSFVTIVHDASYDVIMLSNAAVNEIEGRVFVYILDDDMFVLHEIEIGLVGNSMTEVTYGLSEGEVVVIEVFVGDIREM